MPPILTGFEKVETPLTFKLLKCDVPVVLIPGIATLIPVNAEPSPTKLVAVTTPVAFTLLKST